MTDTGKTLIAALLDRSYSMHTSKTATEKGFNQLIKDQAKEPGSAYVTLAQFDDGATGLRTPNFLNPIGGWGQDQFNRVPDNQIPEFVYKFQDITSVPKLKLQPRGNTPLLDAIYNFVTEIGKDLSKMRDQDRPATVILVILTDGQENCSRQYTREDVRRLIEQQESQWKWKFLFLGSNIDAVKEASTFGITRDAAITYDDDSPVAVASAMTSTSSLIGAYRGGNLSASYSTSDRSAAMGRADDESQEDYKARLAEKRKVGSSK